MNRKPRRLPWLLVLSLGLIPFTGTCVTNARDAVIGGAMDFVSGTTADVLGQLLTQALPPAR
jgi:hypothetical protein